MKKARGPGVLLSEQDGGSELRQKGCWTPDFAAAAAPPAPPITVTAVRARNAAAARSAAALTGMLRSKKRARTRQGHYES